MATAAIPGQPGGQYLLDANGRPIAAAYSSGNQPVPTTTTSQGGQTGATTSAGNSTQNTQGAQTSSTSSSTHSTNMSPAALAALNQLIGELGSGGTEEQQRQAGVRQQEQQKVDNIRSGYSKDAAFADAQGLISQTLRRAMEASTPTLVRAAEGAGTSQSSMRALLLQNATQLASESASAAGIQAATAYGGIQANLSNTLEALTRPNDVTTQSLIAALNAAKGAVTDSTTQSDTIGTSNSTTTGATNQTQQTQQTTGDTKQVGYNGGTPGSGVGTTSTTSLGARGSFGGYGDTGMSTNDYLDTVVKASNSGNLASVLSGNSQSIIDGITF